MSCRSGAKIRMDIDFRRVMPCISCCVYQVFFAIARLAVLKGVRMAAWLFRVLALQGARNGIGGCS